MTDRPAAEAPATTRLPLATLPATVLPGAVLTLPLVGDVRRAVETARAQADGRLVLRGPVPERDQELPEPRELPGVVAQVPDVGALPSGEPVAIVRVGSRARLVAVHDTERSVAVADVVVLDDPRPTPRVEALGRELRAVLGEIAPLRRSRRLPELLRAGLAPGALADAVVTWAELDEERRVQVLGAVDVAERVELVLAWSRDHLGELQVAETIRHDVTEGMDRQQREFLLRQQLAAIRKELGEGDDDVVGEYRERLASLDAPEATRAFVAKELDRLERTSAQSPEHGWLRTWLDRVFELPWGQRSDEDVELADAQRILDEDHYGLADVKSRIVELLAVRALRARRPETAEGEADAERQPLARAGGRKTTGTIITLVGPPGVGKTSLGESIARATGRRFVRVALGGVRDEAEIRGHRRTYVGSQPGRIAKAITEAGTMNPVMLLDEVDKLGAGAWSGDPTAALLEVLDPAQNHTFRDHYLEIDLDLSEVLFLATANVVDTVPAALLDRMDVVRLDGYTDDEKVFIARRYLLPRQAAAAGLVDGELSVDDDTIRAVIRGYTREAGVRSLERELGRLSRKAAAALVRGAPAPVLDPGHLTEWLGRPKVIDDVPERTALPGVATGLAVTGHGGDVLFIETTAFSGAADGEAVEPTLTLTGQLGDVMKESAQIALAYVRSHAAELGVDATKLQRRFHVHVPAGAVPKDGPSAGVTIATALVSLLRDEPVRDTVGMTGELTLQGAVLPIGGVKQKVLAAHRHGLRDVIVPKRNAGDLDDVPGDVLAELTVHLAERYPDVLGAAFA